MDLNALYASGGLAPAGSNANYSQYNFTPSAPLDQSAVQGAAMTGAFTGGSTVPGLQVLGSPQSGVQGNTYSNPYGYNGGAFTAPTGAAGGGRTYGSYDDYVNQSFDTQIGGLQNIMNTLQPAQDAATLQATNNYQNQRNALDTGKAQGERNLQFASDQVKQQKARSLGDILNQLQSASFSYGNQLGAMGAGSSSATGLINQALGGKASRNRGDVLNNANTQDQQIGFQQADLNNDYQVNLKSLDDWKNSTLNDLANSFAQQKLSLQQKIAGAQGQKAQYLAEQGKAIDQAALDSLAALQGQYQQYSNDLISRYQNPMAPAVAINPALQQYQVQPITPGQLQGLNVARPGGDTVDNSVAFFRKNNDYSLGV